MIDDFANLSSRIVVYAVSDDYSGNYMTNPMVPDEYRKVQQERVVIGKHSIIATGCTILPGATIGEGCAVGAMSLVKGELEAWGIWVGIPARFLKKRSKKLLELEQDMINGMRHS